MGFVKGMVAGVLGVAGIFVTAAVVSVVKDEKKHKEEMQQKKEKFEKDMASDEANRKEAEKEFDAKVGSIFEKIFDKDSVLQPAVL